MRLNTLKPAAGAKKARTRLGRGMGSGKGKTCGHGHKGQKARSGYSRKNGFEGGQLPLQRRLPKMGFRSQSARTKAEVKLGDLAKVEATRIDIEELRNANIIGTNIKSAKIILSGKIERSITICGIAVTKGARHAIETSGGKIE
jgi:large subunit ribosomal protein L15